jgi:hypothetical protein
MKENNIIQISSFKKVDKPEHSTHYKTRLIQKVKDIASIKS